METTTSVPTDEQVTVPFSALQALVGYAGSMKMSADSEFICSSSEQDASDQEFEDVVRALGVDGLDLYG